MKTKSLIESTIILTASSIFTRLIGFFYRIYMNRELGTYQMGLYQLIMPIYTLMWSLICSGFTSTISKLTSEYSALGDKRTMKKVFIHSTTCSVFLGIVVMIIFLKFSDLISIMFLNEELLAFPLKILSLSFPFMALGSCVRGYFFGLQQPVTPSKSQILEQLSRIGLISLFIYLTGELTIPIAILGIVFAETISCIYVFIKYLNFNKKYFKVDYSKKAIEKNIVPIIFFSALPLTLNRVIHSLLHTFENLIINKKLIVFGLSKEDALSEFGKITGLTFPLIFFPTTIVLSISTSLLAKISSLKAQKNIKAINSLLYKVFVFTLLLSMFFASFFIVFSKEIGAILYNTDISFYLVFFGIFSPLVYIQMILSSILNGLGKEFTLFINSTFSSLLTIIVISLLIPKYGILGFLFAYALSIIWEVTFNYFVISKQININFSIINLSFKPFLVFIFTTILTSLYKNSLNNTFSLNSFIILSLVHICIYSIFLIILKVISISDIKKILSLIKTNLGKLSHKYD
ncbi:MAG: oligosaccharide flippase family protein [Lachnospirales bacterium]